MWTQRNVPTVGLPPRKSKPLPLLPPFLFPSSFLPSFFLPPLLLPSSFLPLPSHFPHPIVHKACSHPLFYLFLKRSCTQEGKVTKFYFADEKTGVKEKRSTGSGAKKTLKFPDDLVLCRSLSVPHSPSHPASLLHLTSCDSLFRKE